MSKDLEIFVEYEGNAGIVPGEKIEEVDGEVVPETGTGFEWVEVIDPAKDLRTFKITYTNEWLNRQSPAVVTLLVQTIGIQKRFAHGHPHSS